MVTKSGAISGILYQKDTKCSIFALHLYFSAAEMLQKNRENCNKKRKAPALDKGEEPGLYYEQESYRGLSGWPLVF